MQKIQLTINGREAEFEVDTHTLLVNLLREQLKLHGTHVGCDTSQCGCCTVLLDGQSARSCAVLAVQADGAQITTVEGLAQGGVLHPIQEAFSRCHGLQCGFCTPGMLMRAYRFLQENPDPSDEEVRMGMSGNLCRCTGYQNIVKAVQYAARKMRETAPVA